MTKTEDLYMFRARTGGFIHDSLPRDGGFETSAGLSLKVGPDGSMEPFGGNTVVFPLPDAAKREIARMQDWLYRTCAPVLADPLAVSSFHITLHDLRNGKPSQELRECMDAVRDLAAARVRRIAETRETVRLHSTVLFNMINTSMVLGFAPADEESCGKLMAYYELLQEAVRLDYPLTPHVTVAYFRPGTVAEEWVERLQEAVDEVGRWETITVELPAESVEYQCFSDMNHYWREG